MGGAAFPGYNVPQLNHSEYNLLRDKCLQSLKQFYEQVLCPPEAPSKKDHGDVDLLVCKPKLEIDVDKIAAALGAVRRTKSWTITVSFAVPLLRNGAENSDFAQIDIHHCHEGFLELEYFMSSYGDLAQILGIPCAVDTFTLGPPVCT
jgi:hypothetical protein